jgi:hypothetical protein
MINYLSFPEKANWIRKTYRSAPTVLRASEPDRKDVDDFARPGV